MQELVPVRLGPVTPRKHRWRLTTTTDAVEHLHGPETEGLNQSYRAPPGHIQETLPHHYTRSYRMPRRSRPRLIRIFIAHCLCALRPVF